MTLYSERTTILLDPLRKTTQSLLLMGPFERLSISRFQNPLPLSESIYIVLPHLISLIAITLVCFAISYAVFMPQEIRSIPIILVLRSFLWIDIASIAGTLS